MVSLINHPLAAEGIGFESLVPVEVEAGDGDQFFDAFEESADSWRCKSFSVGMVPEVEPKMLIEKSGVSDLALAVDISSMKVDTSNPGLVEPSEAIDSDNQSALADKTQDLMHIAVLDAFTF